MTQAEGEGIHLNFSSCCDEDTTGKAAQMLWWECPPQTQALEPLVPSWWCCWGSLLLGVEFGSSKPLAISTFLFLHFEMLSLSFCSSCHVVSGYHASMT